MIIDFLLNPIISFCKRKGYGRVADVVRDIKAEPLNYLYLAITYPLGWMPWFKFYGLNPSALTSQQAEHAAVLYLPGFNANQSTALTIAKAFCKEFAGPVFTLNLQNKVLYSHEDFEHIEKKLSTIKDAYAQCGKNHPVIHLIGHSRGATVAYYVSIEPRHWQLTKDQEFTLKPDVKEHIREIKYRDEIGKVAFFGGGRTPYGYESNKHIKEKFIFVEGRHDNRSVLDAKHTVYVENSHPTTVYNTEAIKQTQGFFKTTNKNERLSETIELSEEESETYSRCVIF